MKNFPPLLNFVATLPCKTNTSVKVNHYNNAVVLSDAKFKRNMTKEGDKKLTKSRISSSKTMFEVSSLRTNTSS